jgi:hypothetical protein
VNPSDAQKIAELAAENAIKKRTFGELTRLMGSVAAVPALAGFAQYLTSNRQNKEQLQSLANSFNTIKAENPDLAKNPNAAVRFRELSALSPMVGQNPKMAARFLKPRLDKGFSIDDVHKLTQIQSHARTSPYNYDPTDAAKARASSVLDRILMVFGPRISDKGFNIYNTLGTDMANLNKQGSAVKKIELSDECVGEMLGDRYVLWKQASGTGAVPPMSVLQGAANRGARNFTKGLAFFSSGLALAGLGHLAGKAVDAHRRKQMDGEAEKAYIEAREHSRIIRDREDQARDAFDVLKSFAPSLATKRSIVRTFLESSVQGSDEGVPIVRIDPLTVKSLVDTHNVASRPNYQSFSQAFSGALSPGVSFYKDMTHAGNPRGDG